MKAHRFGKALILLLNVTTTVAWSYDRKAAVDYSDRYWSAYNYPTFEAYDSDCANFVSQTLIAGNHRFSYASGVFGANGTLVRANELGPELTANHGASTVVDYGNPDTISDNIPNGDPVFIMRLLNASRVYWFQAKTHAMLVSDHTPLSFTAHTTSRVRYPFENIDDAVFTDFAYGIGLNWLRHFHVPTGPVVKYIRLTQVQGGEEKVLNEYFYDDDYNPDVKYGEYYQHTYNGLTPITLDDGVVGAGELKIKVIFDATMKVNLAVHAFGKEPPFNQYQFTTIGWSSTHQPVDTWEGRFEIAPSLAEGNYTISINGASEDGSLLDSDGNLTSYNPGPDTSVSFSIDKTPPQLTVWNNDDSTYLYLISPEINSTTAKSIRIEAPDTGSGLALINLTGFEPVPFAPGEDPAVEFDGLAVGSYTVTATDFAGNVSTQIFSVATQPTLVHLTACNKTLYTDFQGVSTKIPSTVSPQDCPALFVVRTGSVQGLRSISITNIHGLVVRDESTGAILDPSQLAGARGVTGTFPPDPGYHKLTVTDLATDQDGNPLQTEAGFDLATLSARLSFSLSTALFDPGTGHYQGSVVAPVESSLGISGADYFDFLTGRTASCPSQVFNFSYPPAVEDHLSMSLFNMTFSPKIRDVQGNFLQESIGLSQAGGDIGVFAAPDILFGTREQLVQDGEFDGPLTDLTKPPSPQCPLCAMNAPVLPGLTLIVGPYDVSHSTYAMAMTTFTGLLAGTYVDTHTLIACQNDISTSAWLAAAELSVNGTSLYRADMMADGKFDHLPDFKAVAVSNAFTLHLSLHYNPAAKFACAQCVTPGSLGCLMGYPLRVYANAVELGAYGIHVDYQSNIGAGAQFDPGTYEHFAVGDPLELSGFNVTSPGSLNYTVISQASEPGWSSLPRGNFSLTPMPADFFSGPFILSVPFDTGTLTASQLSNLRGVQTDTQDHSTILTPYAVEEGSVSFSLSSFGRFRVEAPVYPETVLASAGGMSLMSGNAAVVLSTQDASAPQLQLSLALMRAAGRIPVGRLYVAGPEGLVFSTAAAAKLNYSDDDVSAAGISENNLRLYQFSADGYMRPLASQVRNSQSKYVTAWARTLQQPYFAIFASTTPIPFRDATPPQTQLVFSGWSSTGAAGGIIIATDTALGFVSIDPSSGPYPVSGVSGTYYVLDQVFVDTVSTPVQVYSRDFQLDPGTHTLTFFSVDRAGNMETPTTLTVVSAAGEIPPMGAVAIDPEGKLWDLEVHEASTTVSRLGANGAREFTITLPGAIPLAGWHLGFDGASNAYAAQAGNQSTKVFRVTPQGVLFSTVGYQGLGGQVTAVDSDGAGLWIIGQSSGAAALWYAGAEGLTSSLFDNATAQAVLAGSYGLAFIAGARGEAALWVDQVARFDWSNTLGGVGSSAQGILEDTDGYVWLSGWARTQAGTVAAVWQWDGTQLSLIATSTGSFGEQARSLDVDSAGNLWLVGTSRTDSNGAPRRALWQYPASGGASLNLVALFDGPALVPGYNEGNDIAVANNQLSVLAAQSNGAFHVDSRFINVGDLSGTLNYAPGFVGGQVFFTASTAPSFANPIDLAQVVAPSNGNAFNYTLGNLPAPATYYLAAVYDLSGSMAASQHPASTDPIAVALSPTSLSAGGTATAPAMNLTPETQPPFVAISSPIDGSSVSAMAFTLSGTASDEISVENLYLSGVRVGLRNLTDQTWWSPSAGVFVSTLGPVMTTALVSGPMNNVSWSLDSGALTMALESGKSYLVYAQATNPAGISSVSTATVIIVSTDIPPTSILSVKALAADASGNLWTVAAESSGEAPIFSLHKYASAGTLISSTTLAQAISGVGRFNMDFDPAGDVWISGAASEAGVPKLMLWKAASSGSVLLGTGAYSSANGAVVPGGLAADASGNAWVTAAEQTAPGAFRYDLLKIGPYGSLEVGYPKTSQRPGGGLDGGFANAMGPSIDVWSAGVSSNPATGSLDLALWKHGTDGALANGFPVYWSGAFTSAESPGLGLAVSSSGVVWAAASKTYPGCAAMDLALLRYDQNGVLVSSGLWHNLAGTQVQAQALKLDASGNPWVIGHSSNTPSLWRFDASGNLMSGYPRTTLLADFDGMFLALDQSGTPLVARNGAPMVFDGNATVPGASGPSSCGQSSSTLASVSGTITNLLGFASGTNVAVLVSTTGFVTQPQATMLAASAGTSLPFTLNLAVPATYWLGAMIGDPSQVSSTTLMGFYNHLTPASLEGSNPISGVDFSMAPDTTPASINITSIVNGSTVSTVPLIQGTAHDNLALNGTVELALQDQSNNTWWSGQTQQWITSPYPVLMRANGSGPLRENASWSVDSGLTGYMTEGHSYALYARALDFAGNVPAQPAMVFFVWLTSPPAGADIMPPRTSLVIGEPRTGQDPVFISTATPLSLQAFDDRISVGDGLGVGASQTFVAVDSAAFSLYSGTFTLSATGSRTLRYYSVDSASNVESTKTASVTVMPPSVAALNPAAGPIGIPFTLTGAGFGTYNGANTRVRFGSLLAPISVWNNTTINGTVPGLAPRTYAVSIERQNVSSVTVMAAGLFTVTVPSATVIAPAAAPIGSPFTITGTSFGLYNGANTRVRIGNKLAPISVWNDTTIQGTIPGLNTGTQYLFVERATADGGLAVSATAYFTVVSPNVAQLSVSSGPIGIPFTLTGTGFGPYNGANTRVRIGNKLAPISVWNDTTITGTIPGLNAGTQYLFVERVTSDGGLAQSATSYFEVTVPAIQGGNPLSGPIGIPFTLTGTSFGPYNGANTKVKINGVSAPISAWNDTTIAGTIPGLASGMQGVVVERVTSDNGLAQSATAYFEVTVPTVLAGDPLSGPIGIPFTLTGTSFGPYNGANTTVLLGGVAAPISAWNDTTIKGTIPGAVASGPQPTVVRRITADGGLAQSATVYFTVLGPSISALTPSSAPIGVPFTITGESFGSYNGDNTRVRFGTLLAPISSWTDTSIQGTVPGLSSGPCTVSVERQAGAGLALSNPVSFLVALPEIATINPAAGPISAPLTVTGANFGPYNGANTRLLVGGVSAPIRAWNDNTIQASIPGTAPMGLAAVVVERATSGNGLAQSASAYFTVTGPAVVGIYPSTGPIGIAFTITGMSFGPYDGANTRVKIGGLSAPISSWDDDTIQGTIPGLQAGEHAVVVERQAGAGLAQSEAGRFYVILPQVAAMSPSSAPIGVPFAIIGQGFGPYNGANTRVRVGGVPAPISVWNDTTIQGTIPGLPAGAQTVVVERATADGGLAQSATSYFEVTVPTVLGGEPLSGPIGIPFTLTGTSFGPYNGANTSVLLGGVAAPISVWNDTLIKGTIPGAVATGPQPAVVRRITADGGLSQSATVYFTVLGPSITSLTPSTAPIGVAFTITGQNFGTYNGANTRVKFGSVSAPISVWNDTSIQGTVPGISSGPCMVNVELQAGAGLALSNAVSFLAAWPEISTFTPASGPIGIPFTLSGLNFGAYNGANTKVRVGGVPAPISVWNDSTISGTIPALDPGQQALYMERVTADGGLAQSSTVYFTVVSPSVALLNPSTGPIGIPFTIAGGGFGPYSGANTRVKFGSVSAPISVWNDAQIKGTIPGLAPGSYAVMVERQVGTGLAQGSAGSFFVSLPMVSTMSPAAAPIGAPFAITGTGFGPYNGANTKVKIGGFAAPISVWNDSTIQGRIPGQVSSGSQTVVAERLTGDGGVADSAPMELFVVLPQIAQITPTSADPPGAFQLDGTGFGPYSGAATKVLFGATAAALSLWNNTTIRGVAPASLSSGTYSVTVLLSPAGGSVQSNAVDYTVGTVEEQMQGMAMASQPEWYNQASLEVPSSEGGSVTAPSRAAVTVPPLALDTTTSLTIDRAPAQGKDNEAREHARGQAALARGGDELEFGPEGTRFSAPVTIELPFDASWVPEGAREALAVHYWDPATKAWQALRSEVDPERRVVRAQTDHFSLYQAMLPVAAVTAAASDTVASIQVACNPLRQSCQPMRFRNLPAHARVRIYTLTGALVKDLNSDGVGQGSWDGTNQSGAWVASGVYFIFAQGNNTSKTIKVAVQR